MSFPSNVMWKAVLVEVWDMGRLGSQFSSVQSLSCVLLHPHGLQHARLPVCHQLPEITQTHVHWVSDAIQPSHLLSSPSPPAFKLSQHQGLFKWVSSSHQMAKVLEFQLQHQSFQWIFRTDFLKDGLLGSPCCPRDSQESSPTPQFKSINSSVLSFLYSPTLTFPVGPPKTDGSWWTVLKKHGPLEKEMETHFSIIALRSPWIVLKGKKIWH